MATVGGVFLIVVGIILPAVCGVLLWRNKDGLTDSLFMAKVSVLQQALQDAG